MSESAGELGFLRWLASTDRPDPRLLVPLGDDAAVWQLEAGEDRLVIAADAVAEGSHFEKGEEPRLVGRKALAVNLSDLAAMGARPLCAVATCALPHGFELGLAQELTEGMRRLAAEFGCPLVGGDTLTHDGGIVLSVTVVGVPWPGGPIRRGGGAAGDLLAVTGSVGGSRHGRHLRFVPRLAESRQLCELGPPSAMIDMSDGLLLDLWRLADASGTGFRLDGDRVPLHLDAGSREDALRAGEDFELLFAAPPSAMARIEAGWSSEVPVTVIGRLGGGERVLVLDGRERPAHPEGFSHG